MSAGAKKKATKKSDGKGKIAPAATSEAVEKTSGEPGITIQVCYLKSTDAHHFVDGKCPVCTLTKRDMPFANHADGRTTTMYLCWEHQKQVAKKQDGTVDILYSISR